MPADENVRRIGGPSPSTRSVIAIESGQIQWAQTASSQAVTNLLVLAGLFIALSPWIIGFSESTSLAIIDLAVGSVIGILGAGLTIAYDRFRRLAWVCPLLGAWTISAVWIVNDAPATAITLSTHTAAGVIVLLLSLGVTLPLITRPNGTGTPQEPLAMGELRRPTVIRTRRPTAV